eukprot:3477179-Rhodomonas_salina.1
MPCPVLRYAMAPLVLGTRCAMSGTDTGYRPMLSLCDVRTDIVAICLRACYTMPGTDTALAAICLRACYEMPAYSVLLPAIRLCACYAIPSTDPAYVATRLRFLYRMSPVSTTALSAYATCLRPSYAISGTHLAYRTSYQASRTP